MQLYELGVVNLQFKGYKIPCRIFGDLLDNPLIIRVDLPHHLAPSESLALSIKSKLVEGDVGLQSASVEFQPTRTQELREVHSARSTIEVFMTGRGLSYPPLPPVRFVWDEDRWLKVCVQGGKAATREKNLETEGITPPDAQEIVMNGPFHTTGAIVHEFFHAISHKCVHFSGDFEEGLTEYMTLLALGVPLRLNKKSEPLYGRPVEVFKVLVGAKEFTEEDLIDVYFRGNETVFKKLIGRWNEKSDELYSITKHVAYT